MSDNQTPRITRHCTKEAPWDHKPIDPAKEKIVHDDVEELHPEDEGSNPFYKCLNCGHEFQADHAD